MPMRPGPGPPRRWPAGPGTAPGWPARSADRAGSGRRPGCRRTRRRRLRRPGSPGAVRPGPGFGPATWRPHWWVSARVVAQSEARAPPGRPDLLGSCGWNGTSRAIASRRSAGGRRTASRLSCDRARPAVTRLASTGGSASPNPPGRALLGSDPAVQVRLVVSAARATSRSALVQRRGLVDRAGQGRCPIGRRWLVLGRSWLRWFMSAPAAVARYPRPLGRSRPGSPLGWIACGYHRGRNSTLLPKAEQGYVSLI